LSHFEFKLKLQ